MSSKGIALVVGINGPKNKGNSDNFNKAQKKALIGSNKFELNCVLEQSPTILKKFYKIQPTMENL